MVLAKPATAPAVATPNRSGIKIPIYYAMSYYISSWTARYSILLRIAETVELVEAVRAARVGGRAHLNYSLQWRRASWTTDHRLIDKDDVHRKQYRHVHAHICLAYLAITVITSELNPNYIRHLNRLDHIMNSTCIE